jgi:glycosyltransferase involved in cell wall biosynthesis
VVRTSRRVGAEGTLTRVRIIEASVSTTPRILWLTSTLLPAMARSVGAPHAMAGPWIARLLEEVRAAVDCEICVAAPFQTQGSHDFVEDGVRYVFLPRHKKWHYWNYPWDGLSAAARLIDDYEPGIVHTHGSEHCLGLAHTRARRACPSILSVQGILAAIAPRALGELDPWSVLCNERPVDLLRMSGVMGTQRTWRQGATVERMIFASHRHIIGHNSWDRAHIHAANPDATYHLVGEPLRREFYDVRWHPGGAKPHSLFFGNLAGAHKGGHTILRALPTLVRSFPGLRFRVAGRTNTWRGYGRLFMNEARRLGVEDRIEFLGFLDAASMARELVSAHVFVSASHVDNNPNSVAEAQAVGTPVVASYVGGVPEMLDHGRAGLMFAAGDAEMLAWQISRIFADPALAESISAAGIGQVSLRHDPATVLDQLLAAYASAGCSLEKRRLSSPTAAC